VTRDHYSQPGSGPARPSTEKNLAPGRAVEPGRRIVGNRDRELLGVKPRPRTLPELGPITLIRTGRVLECSTTGRVPKPISRERMQLRYESLIGFWSNSHSDLGSAELIEWDRDGLGRRRGRLLRRRGQGGLGQDGQRGPGGDSQPGKAHR